MVALLRERDGSDDSLADENVVVGPDGDFSMLWQESAAPSEQSITSRPTLERGIAIPPSADASDFSSRTAEPAHHDLPGVPSWGASVLEPLPAGGDSSFEEAPLVRPAQSTSPRYQGVSGENTSDGASFGRAASELQGISRATGTEIQHTIAVPSSHLELDLVTRPNGTFLTLRDSRVEEALAEWKISGIGFEYRGPKQMVHDRFEITADPYINGIHLCFTPLHVEGLSGKLLSLFRKPKAANLFVEVDPKASSPAVSLRFESAD